MFYLSKVNPVGKIVISEKFEPENVRPGSASRKSKRQSEPCGSQSNASDNCETDDDSEDCPDDNDGDSSEPTPIAGKKFQKKVNDQRFTIETTVTVAKCGKASKKDSMPEPQKRIKRSTKVESDCD